MDRAKSGVGLVLSLSLGSTAVLPERDEVRTEVRQALVEKFNAELKISRQDDLDGRGDF